MLCVSASVAADLRLRHSLAAVVVAVLIGYAAANAVAVVCSTAGAAVAAEMFAS